MAWHIKKNVDDTRESPSLELIQLLINKGSIVDYSDPLIKVFPKTRKYNLSMKSIDISKETLTSYDAVILSTDHDIFDYDKIQKHSQLIVDTRGRYKFGEKIVKA